jgi:uncharacterized surface protein with fasciclin (FAS1) repeats
MYRFATAAIGAAMMIGAGAAAVSTVPPPEADSEVMNPMIAGTAMLPSRNILDNVAMSPEHTKLARALEETRIGEILKGKGPYTLFAPTDAAFAAAGAAKDKAALAKLLSYHIVRGQLDSKTLLTVIGEAGGRAKLKTLEGGPLLAAMNGPTNIALVDEKGNVADISVYDIYESNGVMHVIDKVMNANAPSAPRVASNVARSR